MNRNKLFYTTIITMCCLAISTFKVSAQHIDINSYPTCANTAEGYIVAEVVTEDYAPPFLFEWAHQNGDPIKEEETDGVGILEDLLPGTYCVTISSDDGCSAHSCNIVVEALPTPVIELETATCICPGGYGQIDVNVSMPGVDPNDIDLEYSWSIAGDASEIQNPTVEDPIVFYEDATYTLEVYEDNSGCTATFDVFVPECSFDLNSYTTVTPDCNEEGTSTISMQIPLGMGLPPYYITWIELGSGIIEVDESTTGSASVANVGQGEYCVTVRTGNGCEEHICGINVKGYEMPEIIPTVTPPTSSNSSDGAISLTVNGGTDIDYKWSTGSTGEPAIDQLSPGPYAVTVSYNGYQCAEILTFDLDGCDQILDYINNDLVPIITPMTSKGNDASIDLSITDDYPGYDFDFIWSDGTTTEVNAPLSSGQHCVSITPSGCDISNELCWEICDHQADLITTPYNCGTVLLEVDMTPSSGVYKYVWSTGHQTEQIGANVGTEYCVTIVDVLQGQCSSVLCTTPEHDPMTISETNTSSSNGNSNGSATVTVDGGVPPYDFEWIDQGGTSIKTELGSTNGVSTYNGLPPGTYTVKVIDDCESVAFIQVTIQCEFGMDNVEATITDVACSSSNPVGSIEITQLPVVDGVQDPAFHFKWSNNENSQDINNLSAGEYCVTITEATSGCFGVKCFQVGTDGTSAFGVQLNTFPGCPPSYKGDITSAIIGSGTPNYDYSWTTFFPMNPPKFWDTQNITDVSPGWYTLTVTDAQGCSAQNGTFLSVTKPSFSIEASADPFAVCKGETAIGEVSVSGQPNPPLNFSWKRVSPSWETNTGSDPFLENMGAGKWRVVATDANGCEASDLLTIEESDMVVTGSVTSKCGEGSISVLTTGGIEPYSYVWSNGLIHNTVTELPPGTFTVTVTDAAGCSTSSSFTIEETTGGPEVTLDIIHLQYTHPQAPPNPGWITAEVEGGSPPYSYLWNTGVTNGGIITYAPGTFSVTVTDSDGCTDAAIGTVNEFFGPINITFDFLDDYTACFTGNGELRPSVWGLCGPFDYSWTGPEGFTPVFGTGDNVSLSGISISGEYCLTVEDQCDRTETECFTLDCDCDYSSAPTFEIHNPCLNDGPVNNKPVIIELTGVGYNSNLKYYLKYYKKTGSGLSLKKQGIVQGTGQGTNWTKISGTTKWEACDNNITNPGNCPGEYLVTATTETGCIFTYQYSVNIPSGCTDQYDTWTLGPHFGIETNTYGDVIYLCDKVGQGLKGGKCGTYSTPQGTGIFYDGSFDPQIYEYYPCDNDDICNSGGYLKCPEECEPNSSLIYVPANIGGTKVVGSNGKCGCLFSQGMIPHFANEPYQVLGKINCNDEITKEANCNPEDGGTPPPPPPVECPSECASCKAQGNEENCSVDYYCVDDFGELEEEPFETVSGIAICGGGGYVDNGEGTIPSYEYDIYTYCILDNDPCNDLFHIYTMDQSEVMSTTNETLLFWLIAQGITPTPSIIHGETVDETDPSQFSDPDFLTWTTNMLSVFDIPPCPCNVIPLIINEEETARGEALHLSTTDKNRINNIVMDGFHSDIFPNPFNRDIRVNIQIANEGKVDIYVHDIMGKEYFCSGFSVTAGMNGFTISSEEANISANGLYYLTIKDEQGNQVTHKIVRLE